MEREMSDAVDRAINEISRKVRSGEIEVYNEASGQHELAYELRDILGKGWKVYLERNVENFGLTKADFLKKEMDVSIVDSKDGSRYCIELKYPRSGQYPEQMFKVCEDLKFLEQLRDAGFARCHFLMFCDDRNFYGSVGGSQIYNLFRREKKLYGEIVKPTGKKDRVVNLRGSYELDWQELCGNLKYFLVTV